MDGTDNRRLSNLDNLIWGKACDPEVFYYIYVRDFYFYHIQEIAVNCIAAHIFQSERHPLSSPEKNKRVYFCAPAVHVTSFSLTLIGRVPQGGPMIFLAGRATRLACGPICTAWTRFGSRPMKRTVVLKGKVDPLRLSDCCWWPLLRKTSPAYLPTPFHQERVSLQLPRNGSPAGRRGGDLGRCSVRSPSLHTSSTSCYLSTMAAGSAGSCCLGRFVFFFNLKMDQFGLSSTFRKPTETAWRMKILKSIAILYKIEEILDLQFLFCISYSLILTLHTVWKCLRWCLTKTNTNCIFGGQKRDIIIYYCSICRIDFITRLNLRPLLIRFFFFRKSSVLKCMYLIKFTF